MNKKTIIIDTVDVAFQHCMDYVCAKEKISHPSDLEWGKGWGLVKKEWQRVISTLNMLDCGLVLLSHETEKEIKRKHVVINRYQPDLSKTALEIVHNLSDIILHLSYNEDETRTLFATPAEDRIAGCRGGMLPEKIEPNFKAFNEAIEKSTKQSYSEVLPTVLIYGAPKIGKSTIASQFPNAVFADFENGLKWLKVEKELINNWMDFLKFCGKIKESILNNKEKI